MAKGLRFILAIALMSIWAFSFIQFSGLVKDRKHVHDTFHYVVGGKYYKELGYGSFYRAVARALYGEGKLGKDVWIRNLEEPQVYEQFSEWYQLGGVTKSRMGDARWADFTKDVLFFDGQFRAAGQDWVSVFDDHGFNPSPFWILYGGEWLNFVELENVYSYLPYIDIALLIVLTIGLCIVAKSWAHRLSIGATLWLFVAFFPSEQLSLSSWIGGSYLRFSWFFFLALGFVFFIKRFYMLAAIFLAFAAFERIFPVVFLFMAGLVLIVSQYKSKTHIDSQSPVVRFVLGGLLSLGFVLLLSLLMYPAERLKGFQDRVVEHSKSTFSNAAGYKVMATYSKELATYSQWSVGGAVGGTDPSGRLDIHRNTYTLARDKAIDKRFESSHFYKPFRFMLVIVGVILCLKFLPQGLGVLWGGGIIIFSLTAASHYYYVFLSLFFPLLILETRGAKRNCLGFFVGLFLLLLWVGLGFSQGLYQQGAFLSAGLFVLFIGALFISVNIKLMVRCLLLLLPVLIVYSIFNANARLVDSKKLPLAVNKVVASIPGEVLARSAPGLSRLNARLVDSYGNNIQEAGVVLMGGDSFGFGFEVEDKGPLKVVVRSDFAYPVELGVALNGIGGSYQMPLVGGMMDYAVIELDEAGLRKGRNDLQLSVPNSRALAIYHLWLVE